MVFFIKESRRRSCSLMKRLIMYRICLPKSAVVSLVSIIKHLKMRDTGTHNGRLLCCVVLRIAASNPIVNVGVTSIPLLFSLQIHHSPFL